MNKIIKSEELQITIYVEDTDFQGFVYHANYVKFLRERDQIFYPPLKFLNVN
jgi:Predicted thioesterase